MDYIPPRPGSRRTPSFKRYKMVSFPAIKGMEKNVPPPGSTPCGSLTDFTEDEDKTIVDYSSKISGNYDNNNNNRDDPIHETEEKAIVNSPPPTVPQQSASSTQPMEKKGVRIGGEIYRHYHRSNAITTPSSSTINSAQATVYSTESIPQPAMSRRYSPQTSLVSSQRSLIRKQPSVDIVSIPSLTTEPSTEEELQFTNYADNNSMLPSRLAYSSNRIVQRASERNRPFPRLQSILSELKQSKMVFDRTTAIAVLRDRIMRGENVSYDEIFALKSLNLRVDQKHLGWRLPWSMDLYCEKGLVHIPTPNKPIPAGPNSFGAIEDLRMFWPDAITEETYGRRRYQLNLSGFKDEEISLYLEGKNRLVIRAVREHVQMIPPTIVTETIILPPDLPPDNLRIVRKPSGTTIIEESWRF